MRQQLWSAKLCMSDAFLAVAATTDAAATDAAAATLAATLAAAATATLATTAARLRPRGLRCQHALLPRTVR